MSSAAPIRPAGRRGMSFAHGGVEGKGGCIPIGCRLASLASPPFFIPYAVILDGNTPGEAEGMSLGRKPSFAFARAYQGG